MADPTESPLSSATASDPPGFVCDAGRVVLSGDWRSPHLTELAAQVLAIAEQLPPGDQPVSLDLSSLTMLDVNGASEIEALRQSLVDGGRDCRIEGIATPFVPLFETIEHSPPVEPLPAQPRGLLALVERCGRGTIELGKVALNMLNFLGNCIVQLGRAIVHPRRGIRVTSVVFHLERAGIDSLPIVGMLTFLVGVVLSYMSADQLRQFGAELFTVNLLGIAVLREMGILIAAIIIAGRSGSAFTAQIGAMKVNQEIDAMQTIGMDPVQVLVLPRVIAMVIAMPLLTLFANAMGILGGALIIVLTLDISVGQFLKQFQDSVAIKHLWVGLIKAPIFGFIIAFVGCFEGLQVSASAESVGIRTTRSVVHAIALVIVVDALFVVFFSQIGL